MVTVTRLRVEELAEQANISVDTIRFYQKRRLVPPPEREGRIGWYGPEHVDRLARIKELQQQGFSLAVIGRLFDGELDPADLPLAAAVVNAAEDAEPLTIDELATRAGIPVEVVELVAREGLFGDQHFTTADVATVRAGVQLLEQGLPLDELLRLAHTYHDATRAVAEAAVEMFDEHVRKPLRASRQPADAQAEQLVDAFNALLPAVTTLVASHFRNVLLQVAQAHLEASP